ERGIRVRVGRDHLCRSVEARQHWRHDQFRHGITAARFVCSLRWLQGTARIGAGAVARVGLVGGGCAVVGRRVCGGFCFVRRGRFGRVDGGVVGFIDRTGGFVGRGRVGGWVGGDGRRDG